MNRKNRVKVTDSFLRKYNQEIEKAGKQKLTYRESVLKHKIVQHAIEELGYSQNTIESDIWITVFNQYRKFLEKYR